MILGRSGNAPGASPGLPPPAGTGREASKHSTGAEAPQRDTRSAAAPTWHLSEERASVLAPPSAEAPAGGSMGSLTTEQRDQKSAMHATGIGFDRTRRNMHRLDRGVLAPDRFRTRIRAKM